MNKEKIVAIIPSRMASSRLPGKPLLKINNLELIEHVRRRALLCKFFYEVYVATCDREIASVVNQNNGEVIMTSDKHFDCNERILEASKKINAKFIVNVQGDEILVLPKNLDIICRTIIKDKQSIYWNAVSKLEDKKELINDTIVKCYISKNKNILFCSRKEEIIKKIDPDIPIMKLLGLQAFKKSALKIYSKSNITSIEKNYSIGQMRILENNHNLKSININNGYRGIDKKRDIMYVKKALKNDKEQKKILNKIFNY